MYLSEEIYRMLISSKLKYLDEKQLKRIYKIIKWKKDSKKKQ